MNFDLPSHTVLFTVAGSRAYGIHTESSDLDLKGVSLAPSRVYLGFRESFEQATDVSSLHGLLSPALQTLAAEQGCEGTVYEWRKFIKLAADANPNILDVLFCEDSDVIFATELGELLREKRDLFLSQKAKHTFSGYAISQLRRIETHRRWLLDPREVRPTRQQFGLSESPALAKDHLGAIQAMIQKKLDQWEIDFEDMAPSTVIKVQGHLHETLTELFANTTIQEGRYVAAARQIGVDDNLLYYLQRERAYAVAAKDYDNYQTWKEKRNPARAALEAKYGYDCKHAGHLYRLMVMAEEILTGKGVRVNRKGIDAELILEIRNGKWTYDELVAFTEPKDAFLKSLLATSPLPKKPDLSAIEAICTHGILRSIQNDKHL